MKFDNYEFKDYLVKALNDLNFEAFTPVQKQVFDALKSTKNIIAKSKTGSGKTHAFLLPILEALDEDVKGVFATIVSPTKELAFQIYKMAQHLASFCSKSIDIKLYCGGTDRLREIAKLKKSNPQIVIGTPGKIKDLAITENVLKIYTSKFFVVDEMDMALAGGYEEDLDAIAAILKDSKSLFFSATMADNILHFAKKYLTNPQIIDINNTNDNKITHIWISLKHKERLDVLKQLLKTINPYFAIIFVNKKETVSEVASSLLQAGYFVGTMHGDLSPRERRRVLIDAKNLKYQFLVATDLAARGIDIAGVSHIINYELPYDYEFYLHRSGRTGRMFNDGIVYSFYTDVDDSYLDNLAKKHIKPQYFEFKNGELVAYKGRATREQRVKPESEFEKQAAKYVPLPKKVKPGYKKKRQAQIALLAERLKHNSKKKRTK